MLNTAKKEASVFFESLMGIYHPHKLIETSALCSVGVGSRRLMSPDILQPSGFGGLGGACWPLVLKFGGSNPAEAVGFFSAKKTFSTPKESLEVATFG